MEQHKEHHEKKKGLSRSFYVKVIVLLGIVLVLFALYNIFQISSFSTLFDQKLIEAKEAARPAKIQLITIQNSDCKDCFDILPIVNSIKRLNVNITREENLSLDSNKAKELIKEYNIKKVPTVLLAGEINKTRIGNLEVRKDALLFTELSPPYVDTESNKIVGRVSAVILKDSSCSKCSDLGLILDEIKKSGVTIVSEKILEKDSKEGRELIKKYSIDISPTLIFSKDLEVYGSELTNILNQIGSIEDDGSYITRTISPPYLNLTTNKVMGLVSMVVLTDNDCDECYDPNKFHKPILQRMGVVLDGEKSVDISSSEGKSLIEKYEIEKVPTILLSGDVETYQVLVGAWKDVGTAESDGTYVFRRVEVARQKYKDLSKGEVIDPLVTD
jgi:thiol-disulfide isomerase/thioredoxin